MPIVSPTYLTKADLVVKRGLSFSALGEEPSFDYALPHDWVYEVKALLDRKGYPFGYDAIVGGFVWSYSGHPAYGEATLFGRPFPLTITAHYIFTRLLPVRLGGQADDSPRV